MSHPRFEYTARVAFGDTDASGWMHFPQVFRFVEEAEHQWLRMLGISVFEEGKGGWPRVRVECDYRRPLKFGDGIVVLLEVERVGAASINWIFQIKNDRGEIAALGKVVTVKVDSAGTPEILSDEIRRKLEKGEP